METTDLRTEFTKETKTRFNSEWLAYNDYVAWLEQRLIKLLTISPVIEHSEQLVCDCQDYENGLISELCPLHNFEPYTPD
jgi:hypothetical protein